MTGDFEGVRRARLNQRLRQAFIDGEEADSRPDPLSGLRS